MFFNESSLNNNYISNNIAALNEVYFGKTPDIQAAENQLGIFRSKYMGRYLMNIKVNSDPDLLKFNRMIENIFGMGCFSLTIINEPMVNAKTLPVDYSIEGIANALSSKNKVVIDKKNGFKFKKELNYSVMTYIYSGTIFNEDFTTEEIMGAIMHEIGHNFDHAINRTSGILNGVFSVFTWLEMFAKCMINGKIMHPDNLKGLSNSWALICEKLDRYMRTNKYLVHFMTVSDAIDDLGSLIVTGIRSIKQLIAILSLGTAYLTRIPRAILGGILGLPTLLPYYRRERASDNFATMYGYGAANASFDRKIETMATNPMEKVVDKIPIASTMINTNKCIFMVIATAFDEHPAGVERVLDQLELLKREAVKEDLDPKMRKTILADIAACEIQLEKFTKAKDGIKDPYIARYTYNKYLVHINGGLKHVLFDDKTKFDKYDETYERAKYEGNGK